MALSTAVCPASCCMGDRRGYAAAWCRQVYRQRASEACGKGSRSSTSWTRPRMDAARLSKSQDLMVHHLRYQALVRSWQGLAVEGYTSSQPELPLVSGLQGGRGLQQCLTAFLDRVWYSSLPSLRPAPPSSGCCQMAIVAAPSNSHFPTQAPPATEPEPHPTAAPTRNTFCARPPHNTNPHLLFPP